MGDASAIRPVLQSLCLAIRKRSFDGDEPRNLLWNEKPLDIYKIHKSSNANGIVKYHIVQ